MRPSFESKFKKIYISHRHESYNYESHFHSKMEMAYCFSGYQDVKIGDDIYTLTKGDAVLIFPNVVHEYLTSDKANGEYTECISVMCDAELYAGLIPEIMTMRPANPFISASAISPNTALAFEKATNPDDKTELFAWSFVALAGLMRHIDLISIKETDGFNLAPNLIAYMDANFHKPLTIKHLAKEFGYSPSYIAHIFCDHLKIPMRTYLAQVRSEYAASLISQTNKTLTEISYECGYSSVNTFCRCFKKHFNVTPSEYKKNIKKDGVR